MAQTDYKNELAKYKLLLILTCVLTTAICVCIIKSSFDEAEEERQEIFVADSQNTLLLALSNDMRTNRPNEAKAVVGKMHTHLFYLTPTATAIESGISNACSLSDASVKHYCDKLREEGWYNRMMAEGISTEFLLDSIIVCESDRREFDYLVRLFGKRSTITTASIEFRSLVTTCYVQEEGRTIQNPNGYRCCQFQIEKDEVLKVLNRQRAVVNDSTSVKEK